MKPIFKIDGAKCRTLEDFYEEISRVVIPGTYWGHNLDAFNDILRGGFGTPEDGFTFHWHNHMEAKRCLGFPETIRQLEIRAKRCHPSNLPLVEQHIAEAKSGTGPTVFDWLVDIIRDHGPGGEQSSDGVDLVLD